MLRLPIMRPVGMQRGPMSRLGSMPSPMNRMRRETILDPKDILLSEEIQKEETRERRSTCDCDKKEEMETECCIEEKKEYKRRDHKSCEKRQWNDVALTREKRQWQEEQLSREKRQWVENTLPRAKCEWNGDNISREKRQWNGDVQSRKKRQWNENVLPREKRQWNPDSLSPEKLQWVTRFRREDAAKPTLVVEDIDETAASVLPALENFKS
ncbi:prothoracicostatic peptides-like [Artemia franciscana]|uniref:prothoracicostatic peptides-like n=1 Tax=Artemia franciscana TaxID=6661 RepID=UPI0032DB4C30